MRRHSDGPRQHMIRVLCTIICGGRVRYLL
jgi:hypothetical protein